MMVLVIGLLFVVAATIAYVALRNAQDFSDANEVIPGVPTRAPKEWAGAHSPEARLHRRLRDSMTALRDNRQLDSADLIEVREAIEAEALTVDDQLVAIAGVVGRRKTEPLEEVERAVRAIEDVVADVVLLRGPDPSALGGGIERVRTRLALVQEARAELTGIPTSFETLRRQLDPTAPDSATGPTGPGEPPEPGDIEGESGSTQ